MDAGQLTRRCTRQRRRWRRALARQRRCCWWWWRPSRRWLQRRRWFSVRSLWGCMRESKGGKAINGFLRARAWPASAQLDSDSGRLLRRVRRRRQPCLCGERERVLGHPPLPQLLVRRSGRASKRAGRLESGRAAGGRGMSRRAGRVVGEWEGAGWQGANVPLSSPFPCAHATLHALRPTPLCSVGARSHARARLAGRRCSGPRRSA